MKEMEVNYNIQKSKMLLKGGKARITSGNDRGFPMCNLFPRRRHIQFNNNNSMIDPKAEEILINGTGS